MGRVAGSAEMLMQLLTIKFGVSSGGVAERIAAAVQADLSRWFERAVSAETHEDVFA